MQAITKYVVGVVVAIEHNGKVLAMKRAANEDAAPGAWELPSGKVELSERPYDTACREVIEECGIKTKIEMQPMDAIQSKRNDEPMILIIYRAKYLEGNVKLSEEHDEYAWLSPDEFAVRTPFASLVPIVNGMFKN